MSRKLDLSDDFTTIVDNLQTVTFLRPGDSISVVVEGSLRTSTYTRTERSKLGRYEQHDTIWHLPATTILDTMDITPELGDVILETDGSRWTILAVRRSIDGSRWRIVGRDMITAHHLKELVDIDQATFEQDEYGNETPVWQVWQTGLPARIESKSTEFRRDDEPIGTTGRMVVHLAEPISLDHTHRVRHSDGRTFRIVRCRQDQQFGSTFQIEVEEIVVS